MLLQEHFSSDIRLIVVQPNYYQSHLLLSQFVVNPTSAYVRFDSSELEIAEIMEQIEAALGTLTSQGDLCVILDECDRIVPPTLDTVIIELLRKMPSARFVLFSRYLPHVVTDNAEIRALTHIIPLNYGRLPSSSSDIETTNNLPTLEVHAFGRGRVYVNGREVTAWT